MIAEGRILPKKIVFITDTIRRKNTLAKQIVDQIQSAFSPGVKWTTVGRWHRRRPQNLYVSLLPHISGDVLLGFDLADRRHYFQTDPKGRPLLASFKSILVPGRWTRMQLIDRKLVDIPADQIFVTGSPRVDQLRQLQYALSSSSRARPQVLVAPLHSNWRDQKGVSLTTASELMRYLPLLDEVCDTIYATDPRNTYDKVPITDSLLKADIVITDYTALIYEAWALGKPVIFPRWLTGDRVMKKSRWIAEAEIYEKKIGHHPMSFQELRSLVELGSDLPLGDGVDAFMQSYVANYDRTLDASRRVALALEYLSDPQRMAQETDLVVRAQAALKSGESDQATDLFSQAMLLNDFNTETLLGLADTYRMKGDTRSEMETLTAVSRYGRLEPSRAWQLAEAHRSLGQHDLAAKHYQHAINVHTKSPWMWHYELGCLYQESGAADQADSEFTKAIALSDDSDAKTFGIGVLHMKANRWSKALAVFSRQLNGPTDSAQFDYFVGLCHDRCYDWPKAEVCYRRALAKMPTEWQWHARLGFVLERQGKWNLAAISYLYSAEYGGDEQAENFYRAGYAFEQAGSLDNALKSYNRIIGGNRAEPTSPVDMLSSYRMEFERDLTTPDLAERRQLDLLEAHLAQDCSDPVRWRTLSQLLERLGNISKAVEAMQQAIWRSDLHRPEWYCRLGALLEEQGRKVEACVAFRQARIFQRHHGTEEKKSIIKNNDLSKSVVYREFYDTLPIVPQTILYESFGGEGISDNPLALFRKIRKDERFRGWRHIWVINDVAKIPANLQSDPDVFFVIKESERYQRFLCSVEYLINNATFPFYFVRRDGQKYLNTWHGTPLKTLGYDITTTPLQRANTARNLIQASLFIAPNRHTEEVMLDRYGVRPMFTGRALLTGYPRIDATLNATAADQHDLYRELNLDPAKPVVLFAPTYRGHWATPQLEAEDMAATLKRMNSDDYNLVFRGHYFAEKVILDMNLPVTVAPHTIDTCQLLSIVDVLVSDYSSIFYDFLVTGRPVIHYIYDWDEYVETRGVYFGKDDLPGIVCEDEKALLHAVKVAVNNPNDQISDTYRKARETFCAFEDGQASDRVIEALFFASNHEQQVSYTTYGKRLLVHCGSLEENERTDSVKDLLKLAQSEGWTNVVLVDRKNIIGFPTRIERAQSLLDKADVLIRFGRTCWSLEEFWVNQSFRQEGAFLAPEAEEVYRTAMRHEARRILGEASFDLVLDYDGTQPYWLQLMAAVPGNTHGVCLTDMNETEAETNIHKANRIRTSLKSFDVVYEVKREHAEKNDLHLRLLRSDLP